MPWVAVFFEAVPFYHLAERKGELAVAAFEHFTWQQYHLDIEFDPEPFAPFCEIIEKCGIIASEICRDYVPFMLDGLGYKHLFPFMVGDDAPFASA